MAIALMPGPPTPTTWRRWGIDRSSGTSATGLIWSPRLGRGPRSARDIRDQAGDRPRPVDRTAGTRCVADRRPSRRVVPELVDLVAELVHAIFVESHRGPDLGQPADVLELVVLGRPGPRD